MDDEYIGVGEVGFFSSIEGEEVEFWKHLTTTVIEYRKK